MMVRTVSGGDMAFNALVYRPPDNYLLDYFARGVSRVGEVIGNAANTFVDTVNSIYNRYNNSTVIENSRMIAATCGSHLNQYQIYMVREDNWQPNMIMQRYIYSCPEYSQANKRNLVNEFMMVKDPEPGVYGTHRHDYQDVMSGMVQFDNNGIGYTNYYSHTGEELSTIDRISILDTWDTVAKMLIEKKDVTEIY